MIRPPRRLPLRPAALLAVAALAGGSAGAIEAANPPLPRPVPVFDGTVDFSAAEGSPEHAASVDFLARLPSAPELIFLDLTIAPALLDPNDTSKLDFAVTALTPTGAAAEPFPCSPGAWGMIDRGLSALSFAPGRIDTHLLLTVEIAPGAAAPYNAVSCDYAPGLPAQVALRVTGFFVVQETTVPTARALRLVPVAPPYAEAMDGLARSIAQP
ncbi:MAG: hypothetical protein JNL56_09100 [Alphaproteobacteria bacterium]|nr:hypothetical protein [Alphaproteobacteria bacterium]